MSKYPTISIVLPVWNGEKYLNLALGSIVGQTFRDFELIIVDDCSTDQSSTIADIFADSDARIRVLRNEDNLKLPASLNRGFEVAKGKYYTWTSDDNVLHPKFLEVMLAQLKKNEADIAYSDFNSIDDNGAFLNVSQVGESEKLVCYNTIGASFIYKKEVHQILGGYNLSCFLYEDYDFWVRAYLEGFRFVKLSDIVYDYRRHPLSLTSACTVPDDFAYYRYGLRKKFKQVGRSTAFEARTVLMGYRSALGLCRWLILLCEATFLNPVGAFKITVGLVQKIPTKVRGRLWPKDD